MHAKGENQKDMTKEEGLERSHVARFEDGGEPQANQCRQSVGAEKGKETDSFLETLERNAAMLMPGS